LEVILGTRRTGKRRPGVAPLTEKREEFARLIAAGVNNAEACRRVGVHRKTGTRWRFGRTVPSSTGVDLHYPPVTTTRLETAGATSKRYLSEDERLLICDRLRSKISLRAIGRELGRPASTISREIRRNRAETGDYRPALAHRKALQRRARPRARRLARDGLLRGYVQGLLDQSWSPEQIAHHLRGAFPRQPSRHLTCESIYQAIYAREGVLGRDACRALRTGRRRRRPHPRPDARTPRKLHAMTMISERPASVADRAEPGHWEGDLITGAVNRSAIGTLVERTTRYTLLLHLPGAHTADAVRDAVTAAMTHLPPHLRRSLTWDQGSEMAHHAQITATTGLPVYFCEAHSPWQRGSNENTNGLLRQYFPKGTDLHAHSPERLAAVQQELNNRPRKTLSWNTPAAALALLQ
jgi:IS30 family transposase